MRPSPLRAALLLACLAGLAGCPAPDPVVSVFTAAPASIVAGDSTRLVFAVQPGAATASIDQGVGDVTGKTEVTVSPAADTTYTLTVTSGSKSVTATTSVTVARRAGPRITVFTAGPTSITAGDSTRLVFAVEPASATLAIDQGVGDVTGKTGFTVTPGATTTYTLTATFEGTSVTATTEVTLTPPPGPRITVFTAGPASINAGDSTRLVFAVEPDTATLAIDQGVGDVTGKTGIAVTPGVTTTYTLTATSAGTSVTAATEVTVTPAPGPRITVFTAAPLSTASGVPARLVFAVEPATAVLAIDQGVGDVSGKTEVTVTPVATKAYTLTATSAGQTATAITTLTVVPIASASLRLEYTGTATAGQSTSVTISARQADGTVNPDFRGTVSFTSDDPGATLPPDTTFVAGDAGSKVVPVTFKRAGQRVLTASAGASPSATLVVVPVSPGAAASLTLLGPASTTAGSPISLVLTALDTFGNVATGYLGTVALTASDPRALLPGPATFAAGDAGKKVLSTSPHSTGAVTFTATDSVTASLSASAIVTVTPGPAHFQLTLAPDSFASIPKGLTVTAKDPFDNPLPGYAGTVVFTSTDAAATLPANLTLAAGTGAATVTFSSAGAQTLTATAIDDATMKGSAITTVHGLVYTDPAGTLGKVRLVLNAAASTAGSVTLDLVHSNLGAGPTFGGAAYGVGMNLPLDVSRIAADSPLIAEPTTGTPVLSAAAGRVLAGALPVSGPGQGVLMTVLTLKAVSSTGTPSTNDVTIVAGRKYFTLKLKLAPTATVGTVFDGQALPAAFRAAVRTRAGTETAGSADFALGKLEVR